MMMKLNGRFLTEDVLPLENCNEICERAKRSIEKRFNSKLTLQ